MQRSALILILLSTTSLVHAAAQFPEPVCAAPEWAGITDADGWELAVTLDDEPIHASYGSYEDCATTLSSYHVLYGWPRSWGTCRPSRPLAEDRAALAGLKEPFDLSAGEGVP